MVMLWCVVHSQSTEALCPKLLLSPGMLYMVMHACINYQAGAMIATWPDVTSQETYLIFRV